MPAEALTAEKAKMPAPITAPARDLLSAVIFNPPFMLSNVKLTPQLDLGSAKTDHCQFQIRPLGVETGQYPPTGTGPGASTHPPIGTDQKSRTFPERGRRPTRVPSRAA